MQVHYSLASFPLRLSYPVVTIGTFDGVHLGHRQILRRITELAKTNNGNSVVVTLWPHPRLVLGQAGNDFKLLSTLEEKIALLSETGIDHLLVLPFNHELSEQSAEQFIQQILIDLIQTRLLVIGYDHRFGKDREGGIDFLSRQKSRLGFEVEEISRQTIDQNAVSSTLIRKLLEEGDIADAARLLGRNYELSGRVTEGQKLGTKLGFPTANILLPETYKQLPLNGVYAAIACTQGKSYPAMMNLGYRPTIDGHTFTIEAHLLDFSGNLYGEELRLNFVQRLRGEKKFPGLDALIAQLASDKEAVSRLAEQGILGK